MISTSFCGVFVFGSLSRCLRLLPPPTPPCHLSHTNFHTDNLPRTYTHTRTTLSHTHNLHTKLCHAQLNFATHDLSHRNFVTHTQLFTHNFVTHTIFHTQLCHTHCHAHTTLPHTTLSHTHSFVTRNLLHTTLSHTTLSHAQSFTYTA